MLSRSQLIDAGLVAAMTAIICVPAFVNGFPFVDIDSASYVTTAIDRIIPEDRPVYYSVFAALLHWGVSPWPVAIVQSAMLATLIWHVGRTLFGVADWRIHIGVATVLTFASTLPWFSSYLMPDVFTGVLILVLLVLGLAWEKLNVWERGLYALTASVSISFHYGNVPIALGANMVFLALALSGWRPTGRAWPRFAAINVAILLGVMALAGATSLHKHRIALSPSSSTFYLARLLDDGPALDVLNSDCPQESWKVCTELEALNAYKAERIAKPDKSLTIADYFLWRGPLGRLGWYQNVEPEAAVIVRRAIQRYPVEVATAVVTNATTQFLMFTIGEFHKSFGDRPPYPELKRVFGDGVAANYKASRQHESLLSFPVINTLDGSLLVISIVLLAGTIAVTVRKDRSILYVALGLLFFLLGNAFVMGAFSGVFDRYQARVVWLLPMIGLYAGASAYMAFRKQASAPLPEDGMREPG